jgi:hypothetical protein
MKSRSLLSRTLISAAILMAALPASHATILSFEASDFGLTPSYSNVTTFAFSIDIAATLSAGTTYTNPVLNGVDYNVFGTLAPGTPSGFSAFNLVRSIGGAEYYSQGSSLNFSIASGADLTDGLQISELTGLDPVFVFNGREVGTGRYHPALVQLNADGTGSIQNSNNFGGINPGSGLLVDVELGEEYITELTFDPGSLTLSEGIPEPSAMMLLGIAGGALFGRRRR